jgi:calcineurin-like phosphoesterase family protein
MVPKRALTWVHLSDFHFGQNEVYRDLYDQSKVRTALLADMKNLKNEVGTPDLLFVTGDFAYSGGHNCTTEYDEAHQWLDMIEKSLGIRQENVFLVPGNHDVDRNWVEKNSVEVHHAIRKDPLEIDTYLNNPDILRKDILGKLSKYRIFIQEKYGHCAISAQRVCWQCGLDSEIGPIVLIGLNSVLASYDDQDDEGSLALGLRQINDAFNGIQQDSLVFVLHHHPKSSLVEREEMERRLAGLPHLWLTGHTHEPKIRWSGGGEHGGHVEACCGATFVKKGDNEPLNKFAYYWGRVTLNGLEYWPRCMRRDGVGFCFDHDVAQCMTRDGSRTLLEFESLPTSLRTWLKRDDAEPRRYFTWLDRVDSVLEIDEGVAEIGGNGRSGSKNGQASFLENTDDAAFQSIGELQQLIAEHFRLVFISGPQLCGKTCLVMQLLSTDREEGKKPLSTNFVTNISIEDVQGDFDKFKSDSENGSIIYRLYAIWARRLVNKYIERLPSDERDRVYRSAEGPYLWKYKEDPGVVERDIREKVESEKIRGPGAHFRALERSILEAMGPCYDKPHWLIVDAEKFHEYEHAMNGDSNLGPRIVKDFWSILENYAQFGLDDINRDERSVRIIVKSLPLVTKDPGVGKDYPIVSFKPFSAQDCLRYAIAVGMEAYFSKSELNCLVRRVWDRTHGYTWFVIRYLKAASFLAVNFDSQPLEEIVRCVFDLSLFWHWSKPFGTDFNRDLAEYRNNINGIPKIRKYRSVFLNRCLDAFSMRPELLGVYRQILDDPGSVTGSLQELSLLTLLRLGLVRRDDNGEKFIPWNMVVERHFSPDRIAEILETIPRSDVNVGNNIGVTTYGR